MLVFDPSSVFNPVALKSGSGGGNLPPDVEGRCALLVERLRFSIVELSDTERAYKPAVDDTGGAVSFFPRVCSPSVPAPSRPDRFWSRLWRLKWLAEGRTADLGTLGRGNTLLGLGIEGVWRLEEGDGSLFGAVWLTGDRLIFSDVDLRIWEPVDPRPIKTSGSDVKGPGIGETGDWLSSDEPEEEAVDSGESLSTESIIWPGI